MVSSLAVPPAHPSTKAKALQVTWNTLILGTIYAGTEVWQEEDWTAPGRCPTGVLTVAVSSAISTSSYSSSWGPWLGRPSM